MFSHDFLTMFSHDFSRCFLTISHDVFSRFLMMPFGNISMCFRIFWQSFRRVWFSSDDLAQSYRLSKRVTNMNPGHVKGDINYVTIFLLMNFALRVHFLLKYSPKKCNGLLLPMYSSFVHILILSLIALCNNVSSLSSSRGSLINVSVFSVTFVFDPQPVSSRIKSTLSSNSFHRLKTNS